MKIALIFPRAEPRRGTRVKNYMLPPYGLQVLAALTPPEHTLTLWDQFHRPVDMELTADLVGISVWTGSAHNAYALADAFRARGIPVVLGGPHVTVLPEEAAGHATAVVIGEAESVWGQVLADCEAGRLKQFYEGEPLSLAQTPPARWDFFAGEDYVLQNAGATSRGCHFRCEFCYESSRVGRQQGVYRRKPLEQVLAEIDRRPGSVIAFLDNDLLGDKLYARALLAALRPRRKQWMAMTSIRFADDEALVEMAAAAGCRTLFVGIESVSEQSLREVGKRQNRVELYARNIARLHAHDIMVNGSFVFGFDHDTPQVFADTVRFGIEQRLETATYTILTPYPNTGLYRRLEAEGRIFDRNWAHYDTTRVVFQPKRMSVTELEQGYFEAYRQFYSLASIARRAFRPGSGLLQRLALNFAYQRVEPLWQGLERGMPAAWARALTEWYMAPPRAPRRAFWARRPAEV